MYKYVVRVRLLGLELKSGFKLICVRNGGKSNCDRSMAHSVIFSSMMGCPKFAGIKKKKK